MEERIVELEIRLAHQEVTLQALNDEVVRQQLCLHRMEAQLRRLLERLQSLSPAGPDAPAREQIPPGD